MLSERKKILPLTKAKEAGHFAFTFFCYLWSHMVETFSFDLALVEGAFAHGCKNQLILSGIGRFNRLGRFLFQKRGESGSFKNGHSIGRFKPILTDSQSI